MPNTAQTRSTEQDVGVLKHEKEELMDTISLQQGTNDVSNVTASSPKKDTLLVDVIVAVAILHETAIKHGHLALSTKKSTMRWRSKKTAQKLKYCVEKTYEVRVKSSASALEENDKDLCLFCATLEELQAIYKDPLHVLSMFQILTQFTFTTVERTMKEFGVSNHIVKKAKH